MYSMYRYLLLGVGVTIGHLIGCTIIWFWHISAITVLGRIFYD